MYISKLELFGFKSFANKTVLKFDKGITGIVGPNGCGKTNTVDAIRWVLGEQKSSTLRSDKMESVIFNGTKNKKPLGMSEVSITFVNDDNSLPTDYSEVTITRRIFRSGESEYLLNKNVCRLKDITNLFMDTGMATNAYSVIELKMIEGILNDKTGERRKMFEEAAGVNKYKHRRRLALKKLDDVKSDLTRVNDIVSEVEKNVRSLERQAKRADKYNVLQAELREKELDYAERRFSILLEKLTDFAEELERLKTSRSETDAEIREIETELIGIRNNVLETERKLRIKHQDIGRIREKMHEAQKNISVAEERDSSLERNIERYKSEIEELQAQIEETNFDIDETRIDINELQTEIQFKKEEIETNKDTLAEKSEALKKAKEELAEKEKYLRNIEISFNQKKNAIDSIRKSVEEANNRIEQSNSKIRNWTNQIAKTVGFIEQLEGEKAETEKLLKESEEELASKNEEKASLEKKIRELQKKELEEKSAFTSLEDKIEFLQTLITNLEGVSKGSKFLIENPSWTEKEKTLFADVGNADEDYRFALEAALKNVLNNLLVEDYKTLTEAVEYLKSNDLGKASFYLLDNLAEVKKTFFGKIDDMLRSRKLKKLELEEGFAGWTYEHVKSSEKWRPYFEKILFHTAIAKDLDNALELIKKYPEITFVTVNGDIIHPNGIVEAGSLPKMDETLFGRKQLIENLKKEREERKIKLEAFALEINSAEEEFAKIDLEGLSEKGKRFYNELNNLEKQISKMEAEQERFNEQIAESHEEINREVAAVNEAEEKIAELEKELDEIANLRESEEEKLSEERKRLEELENAYQEFASEQNRRMVELERLSGRYQSKINHLAQTEKQLATIKETIVKREDAIEKSREEIVSVKEIIEENQLGLDDANYELEKLLSERKEIEAGLSSIKEKSAELEKRLNVLRNMRAEASDKIHEIDMSMSKLGFEKESLEKHIEEEYSIKLERKEFEDNGEFDFEKTQNEVHVLKEKIRNLGPINSLAYTEYEEEKERLDFLLTQRNDLTESEKDLVQSIKEINETAQRQFLETFEVIRENFKINFRTLFDPGDEADLVMEENDDPLEAKIEIVAKPKGKRPTTIDLLSQGEKTLTATALLFAFYLVKPSPFCILDEVDAPLDDANVDRFTRLIRKFSDNTQFIIVTHNKRTMEAADTMYGVTMVDEGISKLAGIKFNEEIGVQN